MRLALVALALVACEIPDDLDVPGSSPANDLDTFVNGFHVASGDPTHQEEVDHYCNPVEDGLIQCALFRGDRLIGVEHIVSRTRFDALPVDEKAWWHPHNYEVISGMLVTPDLGDADAHEMAEDLVDTYGKTWHVWAPGEELPLGVPVLMKAFTMDGQIDPALVEARDNRFDIDTDDVRESRQDIDDPGADPATLEEPEVCECEVGPV